MTRLLVGLFAVLSLSSCLSVEDFDPYWDRGFIDPALEGSWKKVGLPGEHIHNTPGPDLWRFTKVDTSYEAHGINPLDPAATPAINEQRQRDNNTPMLLRSLQIGDRRFLMLRGPGSKEGMLARYEIEGTTLREYWIKHGEAVDFLEAKHPTARSIKKNRGEGNYIVVETLDDEAFRILSELAADPANWHLNCVYEKVR